MLYSFSKPISVCSQGGPFASLNYLELLLIVLEVGSTPSNTFRVGPLLTVLRCACRSFNFLDEIMVVLKKLQYTILQLTEDLVGSCSVTSASSIAAALVAASNQFPGTRVTNAIGKTLGTHQKMATRFFCCLYNLFVRLGLGWRVRHTWLARAARQPRSLKVARLDFYKASHI